MNKPTKLFLVEYASDDGVCSVVFEMPRKLDNYQCRKLIKAELEKRDLYLVTASPIGRYYKVPNSPTQFTQKCSRMMGTLKRLIAALSGKQNPATVQSYDK